MTGCHVFMLLSIKQFRPENGVHASLANSHFRLHTMVLQLHIWGPAFGLPSIDPECIATVAYCQQVIPEGEWALIADFDTTVGATGSPRHLTLLSTLF